MATLRIAETFHSIQGEGIWLGTPSIFIRVSGCNLRCSWCDTPYASWAPEGPVLSIVEIIGRASAFTCEHVVLTGGEPMLFEPIVELAEALKERGHMITIETAGTIFRELPCDLMSISPKLSNSVPANTDWGERHDKARLNFEVLSRLIESYNHQLKFVVTAGSWQQDLDEIEEILEMLPPIKPDRVLLMPEGTDSETIRKGLISLTPFALEKGWRLTPRLHVDLFGNTKGT